MSISYMLYLASPWRPGEVIRQLTQAFQVPEEPRGSRGHVAETTAIAHLGVAVTEPVAPVDQYVLEDHGFLPKLRILVRLDKENLDLAQDNLVELVSQVLSMDTADVVLLREEENVALCRREGRLEVHDDALWASPQRRSKVEKLLLKMRADRA